MSFSSLFTNEPSKHWVSGMGAEGGSWRIKPTSLNDDDADPRFPEFQQAWRNGAGFTHMFGPKPFTLQGSVGRTGVDNHRPDVAKVESFLTSAGYYKPLTADGPSGYHNDDLDRGIRKFQKENGLKVDGTLLPDGPTLKTLAEKLGGKSSIKLASADTGILSDAEPLEQVALAPAVPWLLGTGTAAVGAMMTQKQSEENNTSTAHGGSGTQASAELSDQEMLMRLLKPTLVGADLLTGGHLET